VNPKISATAVLLLAAGCGAKAGPVGSARSVAHQDVTTRVDSWSTAESADQPAAHGPTASVGELPSTTSPGFTVHAPPLSSNLAANTDHDEPADHHGVHDDSTGEADSLTGDAAVAADFVVAIYTHRFDDSADTMLRRLLALAVDSEAVAASAPNLAAGDTAVWPIVATVTGVEGGWWRVEATLKTTRHDRIGSTSSPIVVDVHVTGGLVDAWRPA
jgi:hypothetical protein